MSHVKPKLIVFDWDGTLMDSEARIVTCMRGAISELSLPQRSDMQVKNIIGLGLLEAVRALYPELDANLHQDLFESYRQHYLVKDKTPSPMFEGAEAMLRDLAEEGYFLAVATGKGRRGLDESMADTGLKELFHVTKCADETQSKPHPQMLLEIMDYVGVYAAETLMIGDTEYDIHMAHNAKARAVAVTYGVHEKERLLALQPHFCADTMRELHAWLKRGSYMDIASGTT